jgi:hypothetical protein
MQKLDLRKEYKHLYAPSPKQVEVVTVPALKFAMVDGRMEPGATPETSREFQDALGALYGISFTLKFMSKQRERNPIDYGVMALEGLWWVDSGEFDLAHKEEWNWTLMMLQPGHITARMFETALLNLYEKQDNAALEQMRLDSFREGLCIQTMHVGPYADEPRTIEWMREFAREHGYRLCGKHHEIYLGDPRRAKPEKLKTVLRHPVEWVKRRAV